MRLRDALKFPPIAMFLAILILGTAVNMYASLTPPQSYQQELFMLNPTAVLTETNVTKPARVSVMVITGTQGDYAGWYAAIEVYDPSGNLYAVREGRIDASGSTTIDVWIGQLAPAGNYTVLPEIGPDPLHISIGRPVFFNVREAVG